MKTKETFTAIKGLEKGNRMALSTDSLKGAIVEALYVPKRHTEFIVSNLEIQTWTTFTARTTGQHTQGHGFTAILLVSTTFRENVTTSTI